VPLVRFTDDEVRLIKASLGSTITANYHTQAIARKYGLSTTEFEQNVLKYLELVVTLDSVLYFEDAEPSIQGHNRSNLNPDGTSNTYIAP